MGEGPFHPALDLRDEFRVPGEIGERDQAIEKVRPALPAFPWASEPRAIRAEIRPEFVQVATQPIGLNAQLIEQPAFRHHRRKRERVKCVRLQRRPVWNGS